MRRALRAPPRQPALQEIRLHVPVDAGVRSAREAVGAGVPLRHQDGARQAAVEFQGAVVGRGGVPLGGQDQRRRQLARPGADVERPLPGRPPVGARQVRPHVVPGLEGRHPRQPGVVPVPHLPVRRPGGVVALDGHVDRARVLRLGGGLRMPGRLLDQRPGIALQVRRQRVRPVRPLVVVVPGLEERLLQLARPDLPARRCGGQPCHRPLVAAPHLPRGPAQPVHVVVPRDPRPEVEPAALERRRLAEVVAVPDPPRGGVDGRVEHHPPYVRGEQRRVERAEVRAVRRAHEGQPLLAERRAQHVEVAGVVQRVVVPQRVPGPLGAAARVRPRLRDPFLLVRRRGVRRCLCGPLEELLRVLAGQRRRTAHPARGVADEVVRGRDPLPFREQPDEREVQSGGARSARVVHQGALPGDRALAVMRVLARGPGPADGEFDLPAVRPGVVQRDGHRAAPHAARQVLRVRARAEVDSGSLRPGGRHGGAAHLGRPRPVRGGARGGGEGAQQQGPGGRVEEGGSHRVSLRCTVATEGMLRPARGEGKHCRPVSAPMPPMRPRSVSRVPRGA